MNSTIEQLPCAWNYSHYFPWIISFNVHNKPKDRTIGNIPIFLIRRQWATWGQERCDLSRDTGRERQRADAEILKTLLSHCAPCFSASLWKLIPSPSSPPKTARPHRPWGPYPVPPLRRVPRAAWCLDWVFSQCPEAEWQAVADEAGIFHPGAFTRVDQACLS